VSAAVAASFELATGIFGNADFVAHGYTPNPAILDE